MKLLLFFVALYCFLGCCYGFDVDVNQTSRLCVNASMACSRAMPDTLFGIFFEEINHAGSGGMWAELVSNRGFEAGDHSAPFNIDPWSIIGDKSSLIVSTENSSCFDNNKIALRMDVQCGSEGSDDCPVGGVGIYNPGFWGMNIEKEKSYKVVLYMRSLQPVDVSVSLTDSSGLQELATANIIADDVSNWTNFEVILQPKQTDHTARLQLTTTRPGVIWFDQVSAMPMDTFKRHGFRIDLVQMLIDLKPKFFRFPGGCFVEGDVLRNAFRWKETIGPWEERPGHFGDVWKYWTDDGIGYFEYLQLAEDIGALPIWVFNNGISHHEQVPTSEIHPFLQDALDGIEFARGDSDSTWGSIRAKMGHPEPFNLKYVAVGNEDCWAHYYLGNYLKFYYAIKSAYPDIQIISNCDGSTNPLNHPADLFDFHKYTDANSLFYTKWFANTARHGPKVFVSEYAVNGKDAGKGSLLAALGEAGFLVDVEKNSDIVSMASYAPLFVNTNDRRWTTDAIVFNSFQQYGTPSYWMQHFFIESSGATLLNSTLQTKLGSLVTSAIAWKNSENGRSFIRIKVVNIGSNPVNLYISIEGLEGSNSLSSTGSTKTELTSGDPMDENSFSEPKKVALIQSALYKVDKNMVVTISPLSITSLDLAIDQPKSQMKEAAHV